MQYITDKKVTLKLEGSNIINQVILAEFDQYSFSSVWDLAKIMCIPPTTVW
jgi:hypothetical protein